MTKRELERRLDFVNERLLKADLEIVHLKKALREIAHLEIKDLPEDTPRCNAYARLAGRMIGTACSALNEWE